MTKVEQSIPVGKVNGFQKFVAYMQVICIVLVVLGHSFHEYPDGANGKDMLMYRMMHSFRMATFVFVSGFLMAYTVILTNRLPVPSRFVFSKMRRLLLPYLVLTLVTFVPRALMNGAADDEIELSMYGLYRSVFFGADMVIPFFWFVQASFILLVFSYVFIFFSIRLKINKVVYLSILMLLFIGLPSLEILHTDFFSINMVQELGLFFVIGIIYAYYMPSVNKVVHWDSICLFIMLAMIWSVLFFLAENYWINILCSFFGVAMIISFAQILESRQIKILDHLIGANYMIFLLSWYCNVLFQQCLHHFVLLPWYVYSVLSLISGIYVPYLAYIYMQKRQEKKWSRRIAYLLGQNLQKRKPKS